jgi:hypothetical protein
MDAHSAKQAYMRAMAAHGVALMLGACLWGLLPRPVSGHPWPIKSDRAFVAAHHQLTHQGELALGLAFAFPLLRLQSVPGIRAIFWLTLFGMYANAAAYVVMALTGQGTDLAPGTSAGTSRGAWSGVETGMFMTTAAAIIAALAGWLYGLVGAGGGGGDRTRAA